MCVSVCVMCLFACDLEANNDAAEVRFVPWRHGKQNRGLEIYNFLLVSIEMNYIPNSLQQPSGSDIQAARQTDGRRDVFTMNAFCTSCKKEKKIYQLTL